MINNKLYFSNSYIFILNTKNNRYLKDINNKYLLLSVFFVGENNYEE